MSTLPIKIGLNIVWVAPEHGVEFAQRAEELGVDRVVVTPWPGKKVAEVGRKGLDDIERYAREIGLA